MTAATFLRAFREHPASVDETYLSHMRFALWFAGILFAAGTAALVHALIPPLFETTASRLVERLHQRLGARHAAALSSS